jgi:hypothetical protein
MLLSAVSSVSDGLAASIFRVLTWMLQSNYFAVFSITILLIKQSLTRVDSLVKAAIYKTRKIITLLKTDMRHITTFRSTTDRVYDGGPIILYSDTSANEWPC